MGVLLASDTMLPPKTDRLEDHEEKRPCPKRS